MSWVTVGATRRAAVTKDDSTCKIPRLFDTPQLCDGMQGQRVVGLSVIKSIILVMSFAHFTELVCVS